MDLRDLPTDALIADLSAHEPNNYDLVTKWLKETGIFPGATRTPSRHLYEKFQEWWALQPIPEGMKCPKHGAWGHIMGNFLKAGTNGTTRFYYTSTAADEDRDPMSGFDVSPDEEGGGEFGDGTYPVGRPIASAAKARRSGRNYKR